MGTPASKGAWTIERNVRKIGDAHPGMLEDERANALGADHLVASGWNGLGQTAVVKPCNVAALDIILGRKLL